MSYRAVRRVGLFCVVLFGVIGGFNSLIYAQDVAVDTHSTTAATDVDLGQELRSLTETVKALQQQVKVHQEVRSLTETVKKLQQQEKDQQTTLEKANLAGAPASKTLQEQVKDQQLQSLTETVKALQQQVKDQQTALEKANLAGAPAQPQNPEPQTTAAAQSLAPGESAPPLPTEDTSVVSSTTALPETLAPTDISMATATADAPGVSTPDPEPLSPAEGVALIPSVEIQAGENSLQPGGPFPSVEIHAGESSASRGFQYGVRLGLRGVYDDNINLTRFNKVSDYYFAIEPAIALGFGDVVGRQENYIRIDYAPSILLFSDHSENDGVQHLIRLESQYRFSRLTLQLTQDVQLLKDMNISSTTGPGNISNTVNLDVAGRTQVDVYRTHLGASYDLTGKTFLSGALEYSIYDYGSLISSERILGNLFINFKYSPKLVIGIGGGGGYDWVDAPNPNQTFEQANIRTTYQATGKISLYAEGGVEFRQFENNSNSNSRDSYVTPVYELGATYQPFDGTTITLRGNRRIQNSAVLAGQDFVLSNIIVGVRQRLFQRIYIGVTGGYEHANYFSTVPGVHATRDDNFYMIEPAIDIQLTRRWTFGAYYLYRKNDSSSDNFTFGGNQFGVRTAVIF